VPQGQVWKHGRSQICRCEQCGTKNNAKKNCYAITSSDFTRYTDRCFTCVAGKYSDQAGAASAAACIACPGGKFNDLTSGTSVEVCQTCGANLYSESGATTCQDCPTDSTSNPGTPDVEGCLCIEGYVQSAPGQNCFNPTSGELGELGVSSFPPTPLFRPH
jgi:hypothetical protein